MAVFLAGVLWMLPCCALAAVVLPAPVSLLVEGLEADVAVVSEAQPRFSFHHGNLTALLPRGSQQVSYQLTVAIMGSSTPLWDSGVVTSSNSTQIDYGGSKPLEPFTRYEWTAKWTGGTSAESVTSMAATSTFETGPMAVADWHGADYLLGTQNRFELEIPAGKTIMWARAYVAAVGCHHLEINGHIPLPDLRGICPWPVNGVNIRYQTRNITSLLKPGKNALGLLSGQVMTKRPAVMAIMMAHMSDGSRVMATTGDNGWMSRDSYVVQGNAWQTYINWTKHEPGWSLPSFTPSSAWSHAEHQNTSNPAIALGMPLSVVLGEVKPIAVRQEPDGGFVYEFPRNFVGTIRLQPLPEATEGSELHLQLGEWLGPCVRSRLGAAEPLPELKPCVPSKPPAPPPAPTIAVKCGTAPENGRLTLGGCKAGSTIDRIVFASFGTATGDCAHGFKMACSSKNSTAVVSKLCLGKASCVVPATSSEFGGDPCVNVLKHLSVAIHCSGDPPPPPPTPPPPKPPPSPPPPGSLSWPMISGGQLQLESHILRAGNASPLETLFCWHGFIYVRVTPVGNTSFKGALDSIVGLEIHTNLTVTGELTFGSDGDDAKASAAAAVLNGINQMTLQSQRTNVAAYMP
eukprot:COSAG01_NODE_10999_length_2030_cov_1.718281_1_plen_629_part_01